VPDPRKARGVRHGVLGVLLLGACAVLTGARSFAVVAEYAHDAGRVDHPEERHLVGGAERAGTCRLTPRNTSASP